MFWRSSSGFVSLEEPVYLGILNLTPDSFSDGGMFCSASAALDRASWLLKRGVKLLDLGAESTRPGSVPVGIEDEWQRIEEPLAEIRQRFPETPLSLDTRHASVAERGLAQGISIINDVCGFSDPAMLDLAQRSGCALLAMRSRVRDGQLVMPPYDDPSPKDASQVIGEMRELKNALKAAGADESRIMLDPGFGFGTTFREDLALWESLDRLPQELDWPIERICIAVSRKRFIAFKSGRPDLKPLERDSLSENAHEEALALGYRLVRSHQPPRITIRLARPGDATAIAAVQNHSLQAAYGKRLQDALPESFAGPQRVHAICDSLQKSDFRHRYYVLEQLGRILGFASVRVVDGGAELVALHLEPVLWRLGFGRMLLEHVVQTLKQDGLECVVSWVLESNAKAELFLDACKWRKDGESRTTWVNGISLRETRYRAEMK